MTCVLACLSHPLIHTSIVALSITFQPAYYSPWTPWSEACSNDCGAGTQGRTRTCLGLCEPSKDPTCAVGSDDPVTRPCNGGPAAVWKEYMPQVCVGDQRPWTRSCDLRCHGTCAGSATEMRNCTWAPLIAWAGPLYPTASAPLTATTMALGLAAALRAAIVEAVIDNGEAVVGTVSALMDAATDDGEGRRRREEGSALAFVEEGMVVTEGDAAGSVWLRVEAQLLPEAEPSVVALFPIHTGNLTGAARALAPAGVLITLPSDTSSTSGTKGGSGSSAGVAVGAVLACLVCLIAIVVLVRRRKSRRFVSSASIEDKETVDGDAVTMRRDGSSEDWMFVNPAYVPSSRAVSRASATRPAMEHDELTDNPAYLSSSGADRHAPVVQQRGTTNDTVDEASSGMIRDTDAAKYGNMTDNPAPMPVSADAAGAMDRHLQAEQGVNSDAEDHHEHEANYYLHVGDSGSAEYAEPTSSEYTELASAGAFYGTAAAAHAEPTSARALYGMAATATIPSSTSKASAPRSAASSRLSSGTRSPTSARAGGIASSLRLRGGASDANGAPLSADEVWLLLQLVAGCSVKMTSAQAAALVTADGAGRGSYVLRWSSRGKGLALSFNAGGSTVHELITTDARGRTTLCGRSSSTLLRLVELHQRRGVGKTGTVLTDVAPAVARAAGAALQAVVDDGSFLERHPGAAVDGSGRPVGPGWTAAAGYAAAEAIVASGVAASVCGMPAAGGGAVDVAGLFSLCVPASGGRGAAVSDA